MTNLTFTKRLRFGAALGALGFAACVAATPELPGEETEPSPYPITEADCAGITPPFTTQSNCPKPPKDGKVDDMNDMEKMQTAAICDQVGDVARELYPADKECDDGFVFGPTPVLNACLFEDGDPANGPADGYEDVCKLYADSTPNQGWPSDNSWSVCLNDWVVFCGFNDEFKDDLGVGEDGPVCFATFDKGMVGAGSVTGRELCQTMKDGKFLPPCEDLCES